jgi:hypothetical protein
MLPGFMYIAHIQPSMHGYTLAGAWSFAVSYFFAPFTSLNFVLVLACQQEGESMETSSKGKGGD